MSAGSLPVVWKLRTLGQISSNLCKELGTNFCPKVVILKNTQYYTATKEKGLRVFTHQRSSQSRSRNLTSCALIWWPGSHLIQAKKVDSRSKTRPLGCKRPQWDCLFGEWWVYFLLSTGHNPDILLESKTQRVPHRTQPFPSFSKLLLFLNPGCQLLTTKSLKLKTRSVCTVLSPLHPGKSRPLPRHIGSKTESKHIYNHREDDGQMWQDKNRKRHCMTVHIINKKDNLPHKILFIIILISYL